MNLPLVARLLSVVSLLIGGAMCFSLPWAWPALGQRHNLPLASAGAFETRGFIALLISILVCLLVSGLLWYVGRAAAGKLYRKEAMAVVGLSWILATLLGALPFTLSGTCRGRDPVSQQPVRMHLIDCLFESQSGFSTTGATVISDLESSDLVPHCILFWRSTTHFLGGLGIVVLFVVILGQGSAGKTLMRVEMPGPTKESATPRMQDTAWLFALTYLGLNAALAAILWLMGLSLFDALCHAFGTMATGGFSTYNASIGHFQSPAIEFVIIVFMILAGTNFILLFYLLRLRPQRLLADVEWRTYLGILAVSTLLVMLVGWWNRDFDSSFDALRYALFQVVSIMTTTGYVTDDFDGWSHFGRGVLLILMFIGGCAGSTGGGLKVIRHILLAKILLLEAEQAYHPSVVRPLRLGGKTVEEGELRKNILVYFSLIAVIFVAGWLLVITFEPDETWGGSSHHKLMDSASTIAATLNNIGPGLGTVGATQNYGHFSWWSKTLFIWLMMLGRLEIFSILVLFVPGFWRTR
jgi:trk system potassium uptake protein